jgi:hypothetical protein
MSTFLLSRHGDRDRIPSEDDLTTFIEALGVDLDLFADFSSEEGWVQGVTDFRPTPPRVQIRQRLSEDRRYINRYKFTLAHEGAHVLILKEAFAREGNVIEANSRIFRSSGTVSDKSGHDWMEHQADYCAGVLLMRRRVLELHIGAPPAPDSRPSTDSKVGQLLITRVSEEFAVSHEAARERLLSTGYLRRSTVKFPLSVGDSFPVSKPLGDSRLCTEARTERGSGASIDGEQLSFPPFPTSPHSPSS